MSEQSSINNISLRNRIVLLFSVTGLLLVGLTLVVTLQAAYRHSTELINSHQLAASKVLANRIETRSTLLRTALQDLASNFNLKQLIAAAGEDPASLEAALANYRRRLEGDLFLVLDGDGQPLIGPGVLPISVSPQALSDSQPTFILIDKIPYLAKAAPVRFAERSPTVNAWLLIAEGMSTFITPSLVDQTGMQMSLASLHSTPRIWSSSLGEASMTTLEAALQSQSEAGMFNLELDNRPHTAGLNSINGVDGLIAVGVLAKEEGYLNFRELIINLGVLLALAALFALAMAVRVANSVANPLARLVAIADQIRKGQTATDFPKANTREISKLIRGLQDMQSGIADREERINQLAFFDELTGLPSRNNFFLFLQENIEHLSAEATLNIAVLDVDRFKEINDTIGHAQGDLLLKKIGERVTAYCSADDFVARLGGDEFAIVSRREGPRSPELFGQEIANVFGQPFVLDGLTLDVHTSVGIAVVQGSDDTALDLLQQADVALYACKDSHDSYLVYKDELTRYSTQRLSLMTELKEAILTGQLFLCYQPKMNLGTRLIEGAECLVRWQHPTRGLLMPDEFLPLAEQTGTIRALTCWALEAAMTQRSLWQEEGFDIGMAINISAVDLVDMGLPSQVGELLTRYACDPKKLTLEVTESAVIQDPQTAYMALSNLRRMGVILSIDDFGTGFSSMAQLKEMPVAELKIDKTFITHLAESPDDRVMVQALLSLAEGLNLGVVAEGVENENTLALLSEMGCASIQGYHLSHPLNQQDFLQFIRSREVP